VVRDRKKVGTPRSKAIVEPKSAPQEIDFEGALHTRGAYFHAFHTNGQIGHTCVGPQKLRWPRARAGLNEREAQGKVVTARSLKRLVQLRRVSHALV